MECAASGRGTTCTGPATRRCGRCGAVAYCSIAHQISHWSAHKEECERLEKQMRRADVLHDFPFTFAQEATLQAFEKQQIRCSFLMKRGLHQVGMWRCECRCGGALVASSDCSRMSDDWNLSGVLCPCHEPMHPISMCLSSWEDYYEWRSIPLHSPVSLLLHWPLSIYHAVQLAASRSLIPGICSKLYIHYLAA